MRDYRDSDEREARKARHSRLSLVVGRRARSLTTDDLDIILGDMQASDRLGRGHALLKMTARSHDYNDIGLIFGVLTGVYFEKTGRAWRARPQPAWPGPAELQVTTAIHLHVPAETVRLGVGTVRVEAVERDSPTKVPLLDLFGALCERATREEVVELAVADIRRLARDQRGNGRSEGFIRFLVWWHALRCILAVLGDGCGRFLRRLAPLAPLLKVLRQFMHPG